MAVTTRTFEQLALEEPTEKWELFHGRVRKKPPMTMEHYDLAFELAFTIRSQVSHEAFHVRCDQGRLLTATSFLVPDVFVVPAELTKRFRGRDNTLEAYREPVPFVAEVWSRSTGDYDVGSKLDEYRARGDAEVWLIHPYERRIVIHRRAPGGTYEPLQVTGGVQTLSALPDVSVDIDQLFSR